ncbi:MAG: 2Fe-2S iron-sulfur cluster binding domain-containing protein [Hyphomicrobiales bacterium]|nr:2Fe-2S iron-sulfur cluster binding domain-containing protein [Hyphomicrobiales bacterium]
MQAARTIEFSVNGAPVSAEAAGSSLLAVLRGDLRLRGARFGCGEGHCGACTVIVNGRAVQACQTPIWSLAGADVRTIEAAAADSLVAHVRKVFIEEQAAQCGYCTNGVIMTLAALLAADRTPARRDILAVLDERHLCRCGAHPRILRAIDRLLNVEAARR